MEVPANEPAPMARPPRLIRKVEEAALLLDPVRQRLLRNLEFPISAAGLARRLRLPRQKVNYHLRELERAGFVRLVRERRVGNCMERLVQADARTVRLDPELLGPLAPEPRTPPDWENVRPVRFAGPEARAAFQAGLEEAVGRLLEEHGIPEPEEPPATGGMGDSAGQPVAAEPPPAAPPEPWQIRLSLHPASRRRRRFPDPE